MEDFNSEIPGSSCSIPSEPPDIRNWFSSYKYDSFVLDTCENFGGMFSEERESDKYDLEIGEINRGKEEKVNGYEEIGNADERDNFNTKEDSLHSLSVLSEPSDIRKWFSSYVYESPLLDTNDCFKSRDSRESEGEKHELVNGESINDEFVNSDQFQEDASHKIFSAKLVKCSSSLVDVQSDSDPLFSEPLDIGNWFPDYVYESPVLDTNDELQDSLSKETLSSQDNFKSTETKCRDEVVINKKIRSNGFGKCNSYSPIRHDEQENKSASKGSHWFVVKENLSWQVDVFSEKNLEPNMEFKQELNSSIYGGYSLSELNRAESQSLDSSKKLIDRKSSFRKSSETKVRTDKVDLRKTSHGSNEKEKVAGKDNAENGFITTRKNKFERTNDENSQRGAGGILLQCSRKTGDGEKGNGVMKRKVLAETTNGRQCEAMAMEITGKWRCPQKSKTLRGPPLKQLRLERWDHRV
ncbi:DNA-binding protein RAV1, putative isoform 1 [Hibiscus syriacus]|uniref:DNA-binding protein RAV1, putative isoform 1 n=1 Tax=Hibiscus syriacus TaxID=106335 RepID=A0A6A2YKE8_HIBSY|nr:uncharacterized protein LOC120162732 [Hibiscus syriacus]KAE8678627.1 DNA-binding protein RAV1, putative isoform 1 [Hibiscus syriacus]